MRVRLRQLLQRRAHRRGDLERGEARRDRPRRERVPHRVRAAMGETRSAERRRPMPRPPTVQVDWRPLCGREQQSCVSILAGCAASASSALSASGTTLRARAVFPYGRTLTADQHTADVEHLRLPVDVAPFEREQFRRTQPGQGSDDRDRPVVGSKLVRDRLDLGERRERQDLRPFRLRVRDRLRRVRVEQPDGDRVGEQLPERLDDVPCGAGRERRPPCPQF